MLLLVECLNMLVDHADYFIASWQEGIGIVREVDSPAVGLTFDAYRHQVNEGNLISSLTGDIVIGAASMGGYSILPVYLVSEHDRSLVDVNVLVAASRVSALPLVFVAGWLADRIGPRRSGHGRRRLPGWRPS